MRYIKKLDEPNACVVCNTQNKDITYHLIEFGGFYRALCDNCYQTFKTVIDKPQEE